MVDNLSAASSPSGSISPVNSAENRSYSRRTTTGLLLTSDEARARTLAGRAMRGRGTEVGPPAHLVVKGSTFQPPA